MSTYRISADDLLWLLKAAGETTAPAKLHDILGRVELALPDTQAGFESGQTDEPVPPAKPE